MNPLKERIQTKKNRDQENRAMKPIMAARTTIQEMEEDKSNDLSTQAELDRVMKAEGLI